MRICVACESAGLMDGWLCLTCGYRPPNVAGFAEFAPTLLAERPGYRAEWFPELVRHEADNFWFRARNDLIAWALHRYVPDCESFMEVGCGTGFVLQRVRQEYPGIELSGTEIFTEGLELARRRVPSALFYQMDARRIPFRQEFKAIGAFDVLEHIDEDSAVIDQLRAALKPGGTLILTVPQHQALWSDQDVRAHHARRYEADDLRRKLETAGFEVLRMTSFVSLLLPLMVLSRGRRPKPDVGPVAMHGLRLPRPLNAALEFVMRFERLLIRTGLQFPAGGSLVVVARTRDASSP